MSDQQSKAPYWYIDSTLRVRQEPPTQEVYDQVDEDRKAVGNHFLSRTKLAPPESIKTARALRAALKYIYGEDTLEDTIELLMTARSIVREIEVKSKIQRM